MNSVTNVQQPTQRAHRSRIPAGRTALRRAASVAAGVAMLASATGAAVAAPSPLRAEAPGCMSVTQGQPNGKQWPAEPGLTIDQGAAYTANLETNCGAVTIALDAARAPRTVNSFTFLAGEQYFDQTRCHRLTTSGIFVLQCGDPTAKGTGGPGYKFPDENLAGATYPAGTIAMANSGPNTNGSQFFLVYADTKLPPNYTPFGHVTSGLDVLTNIASGGTRDGSGDGAPATDIVLSSVTAEQG
ncbi:peptidylprolyl isomerase [Nocardia jejuensis]|uniref:peptidylprolyl isomerase n=1 Tax=Nocardia jejuensis TaxID=328049 RepID=UPI000836AF0C|nr:peptidylprolyl isomerase [Nocardia jejuensis]